MSTHTHACKYTPKTFSSSPLVPLRCQLGNQGVCSFITASPGCQTNFLQTFKEAHSIVQFCQASTWAWDTQSYRHNSHISKEPNPHATKIKQLLQTKIIFTQAHDHTHTHAHTERGFIISAIISSGLKRKPSFLCLSYYQMTEHLTVTVIYQLDIIFIIPPWLSVALSLLLGLAPSLLPLLLCHSSHFVPFLFMVIMWAPRHWEVRGQCAAGG